MKIFISVDLEGINGVVCANQVLSGNDEYLTTQRWVTDEVNCVAEALFKSGVDEILIADSHDHATNILPEDLLDGIEYIQGFTRRNCMMHGLDESFDGVILLGYHAKAGTMNAIMDHSYYPKQIVDIRVNRKSYGEIGLSTLLASEKGVPVILLTGDKAAADEMLDLSEDYRTVVVKEAQGRFSAKCLPFEKSRKMLRDEAKAAIDDLKSGGNNTLIKTEAPYHMEVTFAEANLADGVSLVPVAKREDDVTVSIDCNSIAELFLWRQVFCMLAEAETDSEY